MRQDPVDVTFGGKVTQVVISQYDSLAEVTRVCSTERVLALINAAYRREQLTEARKSLERHARGSG